MTGRGAETEGGFGFLSFLIDVTDHSSVDFFRIRVIESQHHQGVAMVTGNGERESGVRVNNYNDGSMERDHTLCTNIIQ